MVVTQCRDEISIDPEEKCLPSTSIDNEPTTLTDLPPEIILNIFYYSDFPSLLAYRQLNSYVRAVTTWYLEQKTSLNLAEEYCIPQEKVAPLSIEHIASFAKLNLPNIRHLSFRGAHIRASLCSLIQLAWAFPNVTELDISQGENNMPEIDGDILFAIQYFRKLKSLKISGWKPMQTVRSGCCHRDESSVVKHLSRLESLDIEHPTLWLAAMNGSRTVLPNLKRITFGAKKSDGDFFHNLIIFLNNHPQLEEFRIIEALFVSKRQISELMSVLNHHPSLTIVAFDDCMCVDSVLLSPDERQLRARMPPFGQIRSMRLRS